MSNVEQTTIRSQVIKYIQADLSERFRVIDNTGPDKKVVAGQFPDILVLKKEPPLNNVPLFVLKIENGDELINNLPQWKELGSAPNNFYIVVPKNKLDEAKRLASATGVKARFAWYEIDSGEVTQVNYE